MSARDINETASARGRKPLNIAAIIATLPFYARRHKVIQALIKLSPGSRFQQICFNGTATLIGDLTDSACRAAIIEKAYEPEFFRIVTPFLAAGGVFFDVGANFGFCSFGLMGALPDAPISYHLFEANLAIVEVLRMSAALHRQREVHVNHCCVSDKTGVSSLKVDKRHLGGSYITFAGDQTVPNLVLDQYVREQGIAKIRLMKMDIEGFEPFALKGAHHILSTGAVDAVYLEISVENLSRNALRPSDCFRILTGYGYNLYYCKAADFRTGVVNQALTEDVEIGGCRLQLAQMESFPATHQTDILAVSKRCTP